MDQMHKSQSHWVLCHPRIPFAFSSTSNSKHLLHLLFLKFVAFKKENVGYLATVYCEHVPTERILCFHSHEYADELRAPAVLIVLNPPLAQSFYHFIMSSFYFSLMHRRGRLAVGHHSHYRVANLIIYSS